MSSQIENCIGLLKEACDTQSAYFSFTTHDSGKRRVLKANKDCLKLYTLELLRKANEIKSNPGSARTVVVNEYEWLVDDRNYNLILDVDPLTSSTTEVVTVSDLANLETVMWSHNRYHHCIEMVLLTCGDGRIFNW